MPPVEVVQPIRPATREGLLVWVMHRLGERLADHAVLKGGMALRLLDCPRMTNDLDYVFVPYDSKREIVPLVAGILAALEGARITRSVHSTMARFEVRLDDTEIQVEISVAAQCPSMAASTGTLATLQGAPPQVVRIMATSAALAHKLAAWNERRLVRDLYDAYFLTARVGAKPDMEILTDRLSNICSRLPRLRRRKHMTLVELGTELMSALDELSQADVETELKAWLSIEEVAGLATRIRVALSRLGEELNRASR